MARHDLLQRYCKRINSQVDLLPFDNERRAEHNRISILAREARRKVDGNTLSEHGLTDPLRDFQIPRKRFEPRLIPAQSPPHKSKASDI